MRKSEIPFLLLSDCVIRRIAHRCIIRRITQFETKSVVPGIVESGELYIKHYNQEDYTFENRLGHMSKYVRETEDSISAIFSSHLVCNQENLAI